MVINDTTWTVAITLSAFDQEQVQWCNALGLRPHLEYMLNCKTDWEYAEIPSGRGVYRVRYYQWIFKEPKYATLFNLRWA